MTIGQLVRDPRVRRAGLFALWIGIAAYLVVVARGLEWARVGKAFSEANGKLLLLAIAVEFPVLLLQGLRWAPLVRAVRPVPVSTVVAAHLVGLAASTFLPLRAGEAIRLELVARAGKMPRSTALGIWRSTPRVLNWPPELQRPR